MWDYALAGAMVAIAIVVLVTRIDVDDADAHRFHPDSWWSWVVTIAVCTIADRAHAAGRCQTFAIGLVLVLPLGFAGHRDSVAFFALVIASPALPRTSRCGRRRGPSR